MGNYWLNLDKWLDPSRCKKRPITRSIVLGDPKKIAPFIEIGERDLANPPIQIDEMEGTLSLMLPDGNITINNVKASKLASRLVRIEFLNNFSSTPLLKLKSKQTRFTGVLIGERSVWTLPDTHITNLEVTIYDHVLNMNLIGGYIKTAEIVNNKRILRN